MIRISRNISFLVIIISILALTTPAHASRVVRSVKSFGMLSEESFEPKTTSTDRVEPTSEKVQLAQAANPFFGSTSPSLSTQGAVKTFSLKVVESLSRNDWGLVKQANANTLRSGSRVMVRPVMGRVSSSFGNRVHPTTRARHFHSGIDIVARRGTPILAGLAGRVKFSGWRRGYGQVVIIDHGQGLETLYAHCSKLLVKAGDVVNTGQIVARVGSTGTATGSHVHFEVRQNGNLRNPNRFLKN